MNEVTTQLLGVGSRIKHPSYGDGVIIRLHVAAYEVCYTMHGIKKVLKDYDSWEVVDAVPTETSVSFTDAEKSLMKIMRAWNGFSEVVPLGEKWKDGTLILKPADENLKSKEMPIETFFHKIVMVRDRLRVMEQRVNSSKKLSDEEKVDLQQYITRIYGSLTSFNVLFRNKEQQFKGASSK